MVNTSKKSGPHKKSRPFFSTIGLGGEKHYLVENLSLLLASGMTVSVALSSIKEELKSKKLREIVDEISSDLESGSSLWKALENSDIFPEHVIALVRVGEESGKLAQNLQVIAIQQEKDRELKSKISSASMYPLFVFGLTIFIGIGIAWFILPNLANVFSQLKLELPLITRILIQFGTFLSKYGSVVVPSLLGIIAALFYFIFFFKKTRFIGQFLLFLFPPIRKLVQEAELSRFGYLLGNLLGAGLPLVDALTSLVNTSNFYQYKNFYVYLKNGVESGDSFAQCFTSYKKSNNVVPMTVQQIIVAAEQSGSLPESLLKVGKMYESKTEITTKNLSVLLEPILLVIVWLGVVTVALAVILPLYSLIGGLNNTNSSPPPASVQKSDITPTPIPEPEVEILENSAGFLNVRESATSSARILQRVTPGDTYPFIQEENGWYEITIDDDTSGWVSAELVEKTN